MFQRSANMNREQLVAVIKKKKDLHQEHHDLVIAELAIEEKLAYCSPNEQPALQLEHDEAITKKLAIEAKLDRAQKFGLRQGQGSDVRCVHCFVDHGVLISMTKLESRIQVTSLFKCGKCGRELTINP